MRSEIEWKLSKLPYLSSRCGDIITPMDAISTQRLTLVLPELAQKIEAMATDLESVGIEIRVVQGLRTFAEQDGLYAQRPRVTNAAGGYSMHNFGLAVDCVPSLAAIGDPYAPDWDGKDDHYTAMVAA